ncbi:hypothetical protein E6C27_scaffold62G00620 [Cucumis melo var. makuwa]|uniref:Uncharacterized protein n=1 Tax=Cucumis melo var. makuwa TaxID=1194695 RepID=A0A5A7VFW6_CUCMM|nr:hypothetical protein E6C27_scaffold62G00620 [Cucumis melo var. makuwa]
MIILFSSRRTKELELLSKGVTPLSAIQLLLGDDRAFAVRSTALVGTIGHYRHLERWYCGQRSNFYRRTIGLLPSDPTFGRSDRAPSSFGEVVLPSAIQLLSGDDRAFAVRSNPWQERSGTFVLWRVGGKIVPSTFSWGSNGKAAPLSSSQGITY